MVKGNTISPAQSVLIEGMQILDVALSALVADELVEDVRRFNNKVLVLKLDFKKDYECSFFFFCG